MKTLKESILGNENDVLTNMGKDVITKEVINIGTKISNSSYLRSHKDGCDMVGHKINPGDFVIAMCEDSFLCPGVVYNINPKNPDECNIIYSQSDVERMQMLDKDYYEEHLYDVLKVDNLIILKLFHK